MTIFVIMMTGLMFTAISNLVIFCKEMAKKRKKVVVYRNNLALQNGMFLTHIYVNNLAFLVLLIIDLLCTSQITTSICSETFRQFLCILIGISCPFGILQFLVLTKFGWILITIHKLQAHTFAFMVFFTSFAIPTAVTSISLLNNIMHLNKTS